MESCRNNRYFIEGLDKGYERGMPILTLVSSTSYMMALILEARARGHHLST